MLVLGLLLEYSIVKNRKTVVLPGLWDIQNSFYGQYRRYMLINMPKDAYVMHPGPVITEA